MGGRFFMNKAVGRHLGAPQVATPEPKEAKAEVGQSGFTCPNCGCELSVEPRPEAEAEHETGSEESSGESRI